MLFRTASLRLALRPKRREELFEEQTMSPELQHVALDAEMPHADHGDDALIPHRRDRLGELVPRLGTGDQGEGCVGDLIPCAYGAQPIGA